MLTLCDAINTTHQFNVSNISGLVQCYIMYSDQLRKLSCEYSRRQDPYMIDRVFVCLSRNPSQKYEFFSIYLG